jgi:hypothetical protein
VESNAGVFFYTGYAGHYGIQARRRLPGAKSLREFRDSASQIDDLHLAPSISVISYGVRIGIRADAQVILDRFLARLPLGCKLTSNGFIQRSYSIANPSGRRTKTPGRFDLYADEIPVGRKLRLNDALETLESNLQHYVAEMARRRVFVHAGVVGWKGLGVLIPGRSFAGKSTLVAELIGAGATYYSDEYAVLDSRGRVHPFARPLGIREGRNGRATKYPIEALGGRAGVKPLPVALVISSRFVKGASWQPRKISAGQGALELLANTVPARRQPEVSLATLQQAASQAHFYKGNRGEASEMAKWIVALVEGLPTAGGPKYSTGSNHRHSATLE